MLLMGGKVHLMRPEIIVHNDNVVLLQIALQPFTLDEANQLGRRNILPTPGQVSEDKLGLGDQQRIGAIAHLFAATIESGQGGKFEGQGSITAKSGGACPLDKIGEVGPACPTGGTVVGDNDLFQQENLLVQAQEGRGSTLSGLCWRMTPRIEKALSTS